MKIYLIEKGCYSSYGIVKVFVDEELAKKYVANVNEGCDDEYEKCSILTMDTDDDPEPKALWEVTRYEKDGRWEVGFADEAYFGEFAGKFCLSEDYFETFIRCETRQKALKIAHERWGMIKVRDDIKPYKRDVYLYYNQ